MLLLYQFTGDSIWKSRSEALIKVVNERLWDKENGGYFSTDQNTLKLAGKTAAAKVLAENAIFSRFLIEYGDLFDREEVYPMAEAALRSVGVEKIRENEERLIADLVLALQKLIKHHLVFTIVSADPSSEETKKLLKKVQHYYHPAKLFKVEKPGHYPDMGKPMLFVCNKNVCSMPIPFSENTAKEIDAFIGKLK
jgi:uncharacterized protein YyaL (SSP411 family)